ARKQSLGVFRHEWRATYKTDALLRIEAKPPPDFLAHEAVAHQIARLDSELFTFIAFRLGQLRVVITQGETTEGNMASLILHDIGIDCFAERFGRKVADGAERRECESFNDDLHGKVRKIPAGVRDALFQ